MGYLLFGFGWAYALGQLPSGGLARSLRIEARLRHRHHSVVDLCISHRLCRLRGRQRGLHRDFCSEDTVRVWRNRRSFPAMAASSPPGFPPRNADAHRRSSTRRNTSRCPSSRPSLAACFTSIGWQSCFWFLGALGARADHSSGSRTSTASRIIRAFRRRRLKPSSAAEAW